MWTGPNDAPLSTKAERMEKLKRLHDWDEDGCCRHCGFDGAEWHHWRHNTYEGRAMQTPIPPCNKI